MRFGTCYFTQKRFQSPVDAFFMQDFFHIVTADFDAKIREISVLVPPCFSVLAHQFFRADYEH